MFALPGVLYKPSTDLCDEFQSLFYWISFIK